jgi:hypothetical protein
MRTRQHACRNGGRFSNLPSILTPRENLSVFDESGSSCRLEDFFQGEGEVFKEKLESPDSNDFPLQDVQWLLVACNGLGDFSIPDQFARDSRENTRSFAEIGESSLMVVLPFQQLLIGTGVAVPRLWDPQVCFLPELLVRSSLTHPQTVPS